MTPHAAFGRRARATVPARNDWRSSRCSKRESRDGDGDARPDAPPVSSAPSYRLDLFGYGGISEHTAGAVLTAVSAPYPRPPARYRLWTGDALISRLRSVALSQFLDENAADVQVMVDHDVSFPPDAPARLAAHAHAIRGVVGGLYAKRSEGGGFASPTAGPVVGLRDELREVPYVSTGFLAIDRRAADAMIVALSDEGMDPDLRVRRCRCGDRDFWDVFRPFSVPSERAPGLCEYLSEDWAFARRMQAAGVPVRLWLGAEIVHHGEKAWRWGDVIG